MKKSMSIYVLRPYLDNKLAGDCGYIAFYSTPYKRKWYWAVGASSLFSVLSFYKHVIF